MGSDRVVRTGRWARKLGGGRVGEDENSWCVS